MLSRVNPKLAAPQALCICPTRELVIQNQEVVERMGKFTGITSVLAVPMEGMLLSKDSSEELSLDSVKQYKVYCPDEVSRIMVIKDKILEMAQKFLDSMDSDTIIDINHPYYLSSSDHPGLALSEQGNNASMLHRSLMEYGYQVTTIQGAFKKEDRDTIVKEFKEGLTQVLISTDLLARGFD
ncbi:hypothetical protein POM88_000484 [Heracleum sosnowskyi]|uniref:Helicase C-terminal domain-containing protein n=1 Tax=Heracleum sosnowskyi TaxID=360622 RepID=A0AAD8N8S3_9APIA|nr:hypothetical protein POM88_000484 [Heracleum sosnowskyi]